MTYRLIPLAPLMDAIAAMHAIYAERAADDPLVLVIPLDVEGQWFLCPESRIEVTTCH